MTKQGDSKGMGALSTSKAKYLNLLSQSSVELISIESESGTSLRLKLTKVT